MNKFSSVDNECFLISFVGDTISYSWAKHHLIAPHEIGHYVLQSRLECLWINQIEVNLVISCYLDSFVSFYEKYEASCLNFIVLFPFFNNDFVLIFLLEYSEKYNFTGTSSNKSLVIKKIHLT